MCKRTTFICFSASAAVQNEKFYFTGMLPNVFLGTASSLKMGSIVCLETSTSNCQSSLRKHPSKSKHINWIYVNNSRIHFLFPVFYFPTFIETYFFYMSENKSFF